MSNRDLINRLATIIGQYYACWCPSCFTRDEQSSLVNIMAAYTPATSEHYGDVIMGTIASQITSIAIVYSPVYSGADQRKHQSSASLAFVRGIHRGPVNSPHKWPVTRKIFPFDDVIMSRDVSKHNIGSTTWWRHQRETFSALLALCMGIHWSPVNSPHKDQWRGDLMFPVICAWTNGRANNRYAGDLGRHRAHYDIAVMRRSNHCMWRLAN